MTMAVAAGGGIVRLMDLTFRISGIAEQNKEIQDLVRQANILVTVLTSVVMLQRMVAKGMIGGPVGILLGVVSAGAVVPSLMNEFSDKEETLVRGH